MPKCSSCGRKIGTRKSWRKRPVSGLCRNCKSVGTSRAYYSSPIGKASLAWNNLLKRVKRKSYEGVEVRIAKNEFIQWYLESLKEWIKDNPDRKPSVDRIKNDGHYELSNLQFLELQENRAKNSRCRNISKDCPSGCRWCPGCMSYVEYKGFYQGSSGFSVRCKKCIRASYKKRTEEKQNREVGRCIDCGRMLRSTSSGKISFAKRCDSCRQAAYQRRRVLQ